MSDVGELRFGLLASHRDRVIAHAACIATDPHSRRSHSQSRTTSRDGASAPS
jgi:hypothetical protein